MTTALADILSAGPAAIDLGATDWRTITQEQVDLFARATGDLQFVHVDSERAAREGPFGGTVAHGYLLLSLMPVLLAERVVLPSDAVVVNYGLERLRFREVVRVGARIRGRFTLIGRNRIEPSRTILKVRSIIEVEGRPGEAVVADPLIALVQHAMQSNAAT
jgi:acyl dehydratase